MKAFVSGADGFMASHLCDHLLEKGYEVIAFIRPSPIINIAHLKNNPKVQIVIGDVLDYFSVQRFMKDTDYVFHGAAISGVEDNRNLIERSWDINTRGSIHILKAAVENKVKRVLFVSTCHLLGQQPTYPVKDDAFPNPVDIYS